MPLPRSEFYRTAISNLGIKSTVQLQIQKKLRSPLLSLTSKYLAHPVVARRGTSDLSVFDQIFIAREYRCLDNIDVSGLILDLGANVGFSSAYFLSQNQNCTVFSVEPDPENYQMLKTNTSLYGDRCKTFHAAVWPRHEKLSLDGATVAQGEEWGRKVLSASDGTIDVVTIPDLIAISGHTRISLLKIDIEGSETELFRDGPQEWLGKVDNIVIELHGGEAENAFYSAVSRRDFEISRCDELTVCRRITATAAG